MGRPTSNSGQANGIGTPNGHSESKENAANSIEIVPMSNRPRLRKVDDSGKLVWPFELEAVLIAGLRKYHATTCRPRPSASRNVNRNKLVSEYIYDMTGLRRSTKQIASRIQVLRDAWKGSKQFALVAQPRELSEMGYLPSAEEFDEMADISMQGPNGPLLPPSFTEAPSTEGQGPMRNRRSTRRSNRMTNKGQEQITPTAAENMHSAALVTQPQGAPPDRASGTMYAQMPSPIEHRTQSMYGEHTHSSSHPRDAVSIQECTTPVPGVQPTFTPQLVSAKLSPHISGTFLSFDLHQLDQIPSLSRPSLTLTVPALQLLESRKKRLQGMRNIVAQCNLPLSFLKRRGSLPPQDSHAAASLSIPQLTMEICSFRLHEQVQSLGENEPQRQLLGTKFTVLHNSVVYTTEEKILARDAGVIEKESINNHDSTAKTRYPLPTQFINRQMFEETHRPILVVQTLSVLRATDSRLLDSLAVLWVFDHLSSRSDETPNLQLFHFDLSRRNTSFSSFASSSSEASTMALQRPNPFVGVHIVRDVQSYSPLSSYSSIVTDEEPMDGVSSHDQGSRPSGPGARSIPEHILHPDAISPPAPSPLSYKGEPPLTLLAPNDPAGYAYSTYGVPLDRFLIEYPPPIQSLVEQQRQLYYTSPAPGAPNSADPAVYNIHH
ncbi:hypothetical protein FRC17_007055 [Serendipita sp. 399]|nr:hypothetical protein FRC17_007055 [Serendipita sp. 399]